MSVFERNRAALLSALNASSPQIDESDTRISSLTLIDRNGIPTRITTTGTNVYGRRFVEFAIELAYPGYEPTEIEWTPQRNALAKIIFAENWEDRYTAADGAGRPLLKALSCAIRIEDIIWKP